jgi:hypothetical protein
MRKFLLLDPDPADGNGSGEVPPVAKKIVDHPEVKETDAAELIKLRGQLSEREQKLKDREMRIAELEDENRVLKTPPKPKPADPAPEKKKFLDGEAAGGFGFFQF